MAATTICQRIVLSAVLLLLGSSPWLDKASAQIISTNTPVPPLQWLNLSGLLQGAVKPPPLKDAAIGYDEGSRSVIIFGGESAAGLVQSQTYLLNLDTLTWSTPNPPANLQDTPAARSAAVYGVDFGANYRHGFVIIGGKGNDGTPLSDIWEYDFINQFWARVNVPQGGPSARYGASGGIDALTAFSVDTSVPGPVNTFYLTGGTDRNQVYPLSEVWRLNISGTLASNLPDDAAGTWEKLNAGGSALVFDQASTVVGTKVVGTGGCNTTSDTGNCPLQDSFVLDPRAKGVTPGPCPAPRTGSVLVRNYNPYTTTFNSQVFLLLGLVNHTNWDDGNGLDNGEVAILDTNTGSWSRILPAGDPTSPSTFPTAREGAVAISYQTSLVGDSRNDSADILVYGGQDANGNLLSELWLLRGYKSSIDPSHLTWSGYGNGKLQSGINANGAGVKISYLQECAKFLAPSPTNDTSPPPTKPTSLPSIPPPFNTSSVHKALSTISLALLQLAFVFLRFVSPVYQNGQDPVRGIGYTYVGALLTLASVGLGVGGLATAFTSLTSKGAGSSSHLKTTHGIAALVLFCLLYVLIIILCVTLFLRPRSSRTTEATSSERVVSPDVTEKVDPDGSRSPSRSLLNQPLPPSPPASPRRRTNSWGPSGWIFPKHEGDSVESLPSENAAGVGSGSGPKKGFEVLNRPAHRTRRNSTGWTAVSTMEALSDTTHTHVNAPPPPPRSLQDIDWLQRRRSLNVVGELDYAITQAQRERMLSPATGDGLMLNAVTPSNPYLPFPPLSITLLQVLIQAALLGLTIVTHVALWKGAPKAAFAVFLVWTIAVYATIFAFVSRKQPNRSILAVVYSRFNTEPQPPTLPPTPTPLSPSRANSSPIPTTSPYTHHQPPYRRAATPVDAMSHLSPRSVEEDYEEDVDEDTRQRMMEEELGRRDVSIVTVPKRKLWIANPS